MRHQVAGEIFSTQSLMNDLRQLGLQAGLHVIVHTSYKALGHVIGGPSAVVLALENVLTETFRKQDGVIRSCHPHLSFAARGKFANALVCKHSLHFALGESSPLARLYDLDGYILLLGAPLDSNTSLHLAEYRVPTSMKKAKRWAVCVQINGNHTWTHYEDIENDCGDFPDILMDYMKMSGSYRRGKVGKADCFLIPQSSLVNYAVEWMTRHREPCIE